MVADGNHKPIEPQKQKWKKLGRPEDSLSEAFPLPFRLAWCWKAKAKRLL